jgi:protein O-mannosyl-transferase
MVRDMWWYYAPQHLPASLFYRPLQNVWFAINYHLFGLNPAGWHATMVALHLIVVWMVFRVASRLTADRRTALLAATLFALMPVHAQAVVWPAAIGTLLSATFAMSAFDFYLPSSGSLHAPIPTTHFDKLEGKRRAVSFALFGGAMLSYDSAIVFPLLIAVHAFILAPQTNELTVKRARGMITAVWPYVLEAAAYLVLRFWVLGSLTWPKAVNGMTAFDIALTIPGAIASYVILLLIPWRAGPVYPLYPVHSIVASGFYLPVAGLAALCAAAFILLRHHPHRRLYLFCAAWALIALGPVLNFRALYPNALVENRYLYLASFGFCVMAADLAVGFADTDKWRTQVVAIGAAAVALIYAITLSSVEHFWHDDATLLSRCAEETPGVDYYQTWQMAAFAKQGDFAGLRRLLAARLSIDPNNGKNLHDLALVDERLGNAGAAAGEMAESFKLYRNPPLDWYIDAALAADANGDATAAEQFLKEEEMAPGGGAEVASLTRAQIRYLHGDAAAAEEALRNLAGSAPVHAIMPPAESHLEAALAMMRRPVSIAAKDSSRHYRMALMLYLFGRNKEAAWECELAQAGAPDDANVGALLAAIQRSGAGH